MQPKMGGKLHLKLNTATRPIANKYREGKMKSTLKRELKARETVERETRSASNARPWFSRLVLPSRRLADPNGLRAAGIGGRAVVHSMNVRVSVGSRRAMRCVRGR